MSILEILIYPDKRLYKIAKYVNKININIKNIIYNMLETMYHNNGIGLSATQVNINKRIVVIDISENKNNPIILINPIILKKEGNIKSTEGCLSIPNFFFEINRYKKLLIKYINIDGNYIIINTYDLLSICIQHEIDHLNGILFIKYISEENLKKIKNVYLNDKF